MSYSCSYKTTRLMEHFCFRIEVPCLSKMHLNPTQRLSLAMLWQLNNSFTIQEASKYYILNRNFSIIEILKDIYSFSDTVYAYTTWQIRSSKEFWVPLCNSSSKWTRVAKLCCKELHIIFWKPLYNSSLSSFFLFSFLPSFQYTY